MHSWACNSGGLFIIVTGDTAFAVYQTDDVQTRFGTGRHTLGLKHDLTCQRAWVTYANMWRQL